MSGWRDFKLNLASQAFQILGLNHSNLQSRNPGFAKTLLARCSATIVNRTTIFGCVQIDTILHTRPLQWMLCQEYSYLHPTHHMLCCNQYHMSILHAAMGRHTINWHKPLFHNYVHLEEFLLNILKTRRMTTCTLVHPASAQRSTQHPKPKFTNHTFYSYNWSK